MLDPKFVRENIDLVRKSLINKGIKDVDLDKILELDSHRLDILRQLETKRALRNELSENISKLEGDERKNMIEEAKVIKEDVQRLEIEFKKIDHVFYEEFIRLPNIPSEEMPVGQGEEDDIILKVWLPEKGYLKIDGGTKYTDTSYMPLAARVYKDHVELGKVLDLIDVEKSAEVSGSRFCYLKNEAVLLQDAIFALMKKRLQGMGYMPIVPPILVKETALFGTSHFPEGIEDVYKIENYNVEEKNELYLVGSSEPANFAYFMNKTFDAKELPKKVYAQTTCFRSEVGSWGRDVRGIKRVHQFDKLEMNAVCTQDQSREVFEEFLATNEWLLQSLKLPYRIVNHCTGDSGYNASHLQYDLEVWRPGEEEFMEVMTNTITTDYQARRLNIKYKAGDETKYVHTVNDTGVAMGRMLIAILENYQQEDGSVLIPSVLADEIGLSEIKKSGEEGRK